MTRKMNSMGIWQQWHLFSYAGNDPLVCGWTSDTGAALGAVLVSWSDDYAEPERDDGEGAASGAMSVAKSFAAVAFAGVQFCIVLDGRCNERLMPQTKCWHIPRIQDVQLTATMLPTD